MPGHYDRFKDQPSIPQSFAAKKANPGSSEAADKAIDRSGRAKTKKTKSNREINEALEKKQKDRRDQANIKDDGILAGIGFRGQDVDRTVKKDDDKYNDPRKHKLRRQFDYLVDKYYGGTKKGAEEFAKTSQGQVLLGYLAGVSADRGGGRGGDRDALQAGAPDLFQRTQELKSPRDLEFIYNRPITPFDIRNLSAQAVKDNLTKAGITDTNAFKRFNEALRIAAPNAFDEARPNFGQNLTKLAESLAPLPLKGLSYILPEKAIGGLSPDEYLDQSLFENLPTQTTDQGGMNDVAQFMIDNQTPIEEEEEETNIVKFDPNSFIPGFGFPFVDPSLFNLDGTGITGLQV